jgi:hypothetical protein
MHYTNAEDVLKTMESHEASPKQATLYYYNESNRTRVSIEILEEKCIMFSQHLKKRENQCFVSHT